MAGDPIGSSLHIGRRQVAALLVSGASVFAVGRLALALQPEAVTVASAEELQSATLPASVDKVIVSGRDGAAFVPADATSLPASREGSWWILSNSGSRAWQLEYHPIMNPEMFGAVEDGAGDATGLLDSAIEFLTSHGGGTLRFASGKTYRLASVAPGTERLNRALAASIGLPPGTRNLTFDLNGCTLLQACDALTFGAKYRRFNDPPLRNTIKPILGPWPRRGDRAVQLAEMAEFQGGDVVMLVSCNVASRPIYTPVAEMLVIEAVNGNMITFTETLSKDHEPDGENLIGLIRLNDDSIRNCAIVGPGTIVNHQRRCGNVTQVIGFRMSKVKCEGRGGMVIRGRHIVVEDCISIINANWSEPLYRPYALAFDTGTSEVKVRNFVADGGDNITYLHLHEGLADVLVRNVKIRNGTQYDSRAPAVAAVSILGTSWNVWIDDVTIVNNPQGPGLVARESAVVARGNRELRIEKLRLEGNFRTRALLVRDREVADIKGVELIGTTSGTAQDLVVIEGAAHRVSG